MTRDAILREFIHASNAVCESVSTSKSLNFRESVGGVVVKSTYYAALPENARSDTNLAAIATAAELYCSGYDINITVPIGKGSKGGTMDFHEFLRYNVQDFFFECSGRQRTSGAVYCYWFASLLLLTKFCWIENKYINVSYGAELLVALNTVVDTRSASRTMSSCLKCLRIAEEMC